MRSVTRIELLDHVGAAFDGGPASRDALLAAAVESNARPDVIAPLRRLPNRDFR